MILTKLLRTSWSAFCATAMLLTTTSRADELQLLWQKSAADGLPYLGTGNADRGVAINPVTGNILVVSRTTVGNPGEVYILNGQTGEQIGILSVGSDPTLIAGGTFVQSLIGIADDGVIYVANLTTSTANPQFRVYRWASETDPEPVLAYAGDPSGGDTAAPRWGDSFDVRGAGTNTQWIAGAGGTATVGAVFTTTDGTNFTPTKITNIAANSVAFGEGDTVWTKRSAQGLRLIGFDLATGTGTILANVPTTVVPGTAIPLGVNATNQHLGIVNIATGVDDFRLYDFSDTNNLVIIDQEVFPADNANANGAGAVDIKGDIIAALDTNNGLMVFRILKTVSPPNFTSQPAATTIIEGGYASLVANVAGTQPITFRWQVDGVDVPRGTNSSLTFTNVTLGEGGSYTLIASNAALSVTSNPAQITIQPAVQTDFANILWRLAPGSRPYITANNSERGLAYNVSSNHVLLASRHDGAAHIYVLDGDTGAELWQMQVPTDIIPPTASTPGGFHLNMIGVADDGVVYGANLTTGAGSGNAAYRIYRWENDGPDTMPVLVYEGAPIAGKRFGDTFDVRGAGNDTQILLGNNIAAAPEVDNSTVIMSTTDAGLSWTPNVIVTPGVSSEYFRLGVAFGSSNTFWGKTSGQPLHQVQFDLATGAGTLMQTFTNLPNLATAISVSSNLVAVLALETPDNLRVYELTATGDDLTLRDQEFFLANNDNGNGTGSVDFGTNRVYAVNTHNGLVALELTGNTGTNEEPATFGSVTSDGNSLTFTVTGTPNATCQLEGTSDFATWTNVQTLNIENDGSNQVTVANSGPYRFYRAVAQ